MIDNRFSVCQSKTVIIVKELFMRTFHENFAWSTFSIVMRTFHENFAWSTFSIVIVYGMNAIKYGSKEFLRTVYDHFT